MYKIAKLLQIFCLLGLMASCEMNDSYKDCATDVDLRFEYYGDSTKNVLANHIEKGTLYIYDESGKLVSSLDVTGNELQKGKLVHLKFGKYKFICWGNQTDKSKVIDMNNFETARIAASEFFAKKQIQSNDKLYYATGDLDLTSPSLSDSERKPNKTLTFRNSHINFIVRAYGYKNNDNLQLEIQNLMPEYNFQMAPVAPFSTTHFPGEKTIGNDKKGKPYLEFKATTLRFPQNNNIVIKLFDRKKKTTAIKEIKLADYLKQEEINIENKQETTLLIIFRFPQDEKDGKIVIEISEWGDQKIIPIG